MSETVFQPTIATRQFGASFLDNITSTLTEGVIPVRNKMLAAIEKLKSDPSNPQLLTEVQLASTEFAILNTTMSSLMNAVKQTDLGIANHLS